VTGEELFNAETIVAIEEGRAMMRGEIPALRFHSFEEMVADLERYDPDEDDCPMLEPIYPKIFRKQYKLMKKRGMAVNKLLEIMNMIISERPLPAERDNHQLHGKWKDMLECHIQGDWALVSSPKIG
jgi:mRNA interferase YafQ